MTVTALSALFMALACLFSLFGGFAFAGAYTTAVLPLILVTLFYCRGLATIDRLCTYILVVFLWSFYLARPLFLLTDLEYYKFGIIMGDFIDVHVHTLFWLAGLNTISVVIAMVVLGSFLRIPSSSLLPGPRLARLPTILFFAAIAIMGLYFLLSLLEAMGSDLGRKAVRLMELAAFVQITIPVMVGFLIVRNTAPGNQQRTWLALTAVLLYSGALFLQGSKLFVIELVVLFFLFMLVFYGDRKLSLPWIGAYAGLTVLVVISFPLAMAVRRLTGEMGLSGLSPSLIVDRIDMMSSYMSGNSIWEFPLDLLTRRLNGYDGLIVAFDKVSYADLSDFNVMTMLSNALAGLLPGVAADSISFGQLTSRLFYGFAVEDDVAHAGGVGHFGMLRLFAGSPVLTFVLGVTLFAFIWSATLVAACRMLHNPLLRFALFGSLIMTSALCLSGGNFDRVLQETIIAFVHAAILSVFITYRQPVLRRREPVR